LFSSQVFWKTIALFALLIAKTNATNVLNLFISLEQAEMAMSFPSSGGIQAIPKKQNNTKKYIDA